MDNPTEQNTKDAVLARIREKRILMRPKFLFTFDALLAGFVALVILAVSIALVGFIFFSLRVGGHESLLSFGPRGMATFLLVFPWPLLALDILLVLFLETLLRRFKFGYRSPVLYLLIVLIAIAGGAGLALDRATHVNDDLLDQADHGGLPPPFGEVYEHLHGPAPHDRGIFRGVVNGIGTSTFSMSGENFDNATDTVIYRVIVPPSTSIGDFNTGEYVYVAGDLEGTTTIRAFGIRVLSTK